MYKEAIIIIRTIRIKTMIIFKIKILINNFLYRLCKLNRDQVRNDSQHKPKPLGYSPI